MILGQTDDGVDITVDLDRLIGSHLGIVANAGGGKSGLIRKLLEATHGHIQHIVLDIEDEFYTLRQSYDYVIAGGDGADAPATPANAAGLATAALTNGFSLICQLNDLGGQGASEFVDAFLSAMITAPRDLWRPVLIVIDETQRFNPESIRMLTERGRKRGFTAVLASQRLPKIDANIRGDLNNWIMGRVGQSLDRRIMADQLGFTPTDKRLTGIDSRHFWAFGPALAKEPVLFKVGEVETTMVKPGQAKVQTPPAPEALREILAALVPVDVPTADGPELVHSEAAESRELIDLRARIAGFEAELAHLREREERAYGSGRTAGIGIGLLRASQAIAALRIPVIDSEVPQVQPVSAVTPGAVPEPERQPRPARAELSGDSTELTRSAQKMVDALAKHYPRSLPIEHVAKIAGVSTSSSQWRENRRSFVTCPLVAPHGDQWRMTTRGVAELGLQQQPDDPKALLDFWVRSFPPSTANMLRVLVGACGAVMTKENIAHQAGVSLTSSGLPGGLRELQTHGLIVAERGGYRAAAVLL
jgi:hypothetical protein